MAESEKSESDFKKQIKKIIEEDAELLRDLARGKRVERSTKQQ